MVAALFSGPWSACWAEADSVVQGLSGVWAIWLAALSAVGGRVVVWWWSGWR